MNRQLAKDLLLTTKEVLERSSVPFFLFQGTALGAVRDGDFPPTDRDIDLGVLHEHLAPVAWELAKDFSLRGLDVELFCMPFSAPRTLVIWNEGAKLDLVGLIKRTVGGKPVRYTFGPFREYDCERYGLVYPAEMIEATQEVSMFGRTWRVPSPAEAYLEAEYGPDWRVPADDCVSRARVYGFLEREGVWPLKS